MTCLMQKKPVSNAYLLVIQVKPSTTSNAASIADSKVLNGRGGGGEECVKISHSIPLVPNQLYVLVNSYICNFEFLVFLYFCTVL